MRFLIRAWIYFKMTLDIIVSIVAKCDPFLSLDCARVEGGVCGGAIQGKEGIKFCSVAQRSHSPSSPKGQTPTIRKFGYSHLATMLGMRVYATRARRVCVSPDQTRRDLPSSPLLRHALSEAQCGVWFSSPPSSSHHPVAAWRSQTQFMLGDNYFDNIWKLWKIDV